MLQKILLRIFPFIKLVKIDLLWQYGYRYTENTIYKLSSSVGFRISKKLALFTSEGKNFKSLNINLSKHIEVSVYKDHFWTSFFGLYYQ